MYAKPSHLQIYMGLGELLATGGTITGAAALEAGKQAVVSVMQSGQGKDKAGDKEKEKGVSAKPAGTKSSKR